MCDEVSGSWWDKSNHTDNSSGKVNLLSTIRTYVGADVRDFATSPKYFSGKVDNLRIYSRALSATEIQAFFNNWIKRNVYWLYWILKN